MVRQRVVIRRSIRGDARRRARVHLRTAVLCGRWGTPGCDLIGLSLPGCERAFALFVFVKVFSNHSGFLGVLGKQLLDHIGMRG